MADLRYPAEILKDDTDWFSINVFQYDAKGGSLAKDSPTGITTVSQYFTSGTQGESLGTVILPMPSNIQDGNSVDYGENTMNTITGAAVSGIENLMNFDLGNIPTSLANAGEAAKTALDQSGLDINIAGGLIKKTLAAEAVSIFGGNVTIDSLLARENGEIFNPNMELLFSGVTLRTFRFSFKMTPRNDRESDNIKYIIWFLKKNMAAKGGQGNLFLKTPNVFELQYKKGRNKHPFLHSFKPCFLKDMAVNYTGDNVYTTYCDGTPISLSMDLTFQEMFPIYDGDYSKKFSEDQYGVGY